MQKKVQRAKIRQLVSNDFAADEASKMRFHPRGRHFAKQDRIVLGLMGDDADIRGVAFIAGAAVRDDRQRNLHSTTSMLVSISDRGTSAGQ